MATDIYGIDEITGTQDDKHVTANEAIRALEALIAPAKSMSNGGPPGAPSNGDVYIVDVNSGDWTSASVNDIAYYYGGSWHFYTPVKGTLKVILDETDSLHTEGIIYIFSDDSVGWIEY